MPIIPMLSRLDTVVGGDLVPVWQASNSDVRAASMTTMLKFFDENSTAPAAAAASAEAAAASAAEAALYEGVWFDTASDVIADTTLTYTPDLPETIVAGDYIRTRAKAVSYKVALAAATDHQVITAGGVKLYAIPDIDSRVSTEQMGWVPGADVTPQIVSFLASNLTGIKVLIISDVYLMQGGGYVIPDGFEAFVAQDYESLQHGEDATAGFRFMDANPQTAAVYGLAHFLGDVFDTPSGFAAKGLLFNDATAVVETLLVSGNNRGAVFKCIDNPVGITIDKCRFNQAGGVGILLRNSQKWKFTNNYAGKQKYLLFIYEACDHGLYEGNFGRMGFKGLNISGTAPQIFGDYIKTSAVDNRGPRYCAVTRNYFLNDLRDGPDGTGGFGGWVFSENTFEVNVAGIDIKQQYNDASALTKEENLYLGIRIVNNTFIGCGVIYTSTWNESAVGLPFDQDKQIRNVVCDGNVYLSKVGKASYAHYSKSTSRISCSNEQFISIKTDDAGPWDASSGAFPASSVYETHYVVSVGGVVDGVTFNVGDYLRPLLDDAATDTFANNWTVSVNETPWVGTYPLKVDGTGSTGLVDGGAWDASAGTFPSSSVVGTYYNVSVAGTVDGIAFEVGNYLVPQIANASTTLYDDNWIKRLISEEVLPSYISMKGMRWDSRGASTMALSNCHHCDLHFAELITDGTSALSLGGEHNTISGRMRGFAKPAGFSGVVDPITLASSRDCAIDLDYDFESSGDKGSMIRPVGTVERLRFDGSANNCSEVIDGANGTIIDMKVGFGRGFNMRNTFRFLTTSSATVDGLFFGNVELNGSSPYNGSPAFHTMDTLKTYLGSELTIASGVVLATHSVHPIDTEADAATDDLVTINGGQLGDRLTIVAANDARTVVAKNGTGNLVLGADRTLDNIADTLVVEKLGDGNWHQVSFNDLGV